MTDSLRPILIGTTIGAVILATLWFVSLGGTP